MDSKRKFKLKKNHNSNGSHTLPISHLMPNVITTLGLCFGLSSIKLALSQKFETAVFFIMIAAILDFLDGGVARLLNAESKIGAQLDSFADLINFGFCPVFLVYLWRLNEIPIFGWGCVLLSVICMAYRLSRFNVQSGNPPNPIMSKFFTGVPAPAAATLLLLPVFAEVRFPSLVFFIDDIYIVLYIVLICLLMISTLPTPALKKMRVKPSKIPFVMLIFAILIICLFIDKWSVFTFFCLVYLASLPFWCLYYLKLLKEYKRKPIDV